MSDTYPCHAQLIFVSKMGPRFRKLWQLSPTKRYQLFDYTEEGQWFVFKCWNLSKADQR